MSDELITLNTMLYVGGSKDAYRCSCGSNVFSKKRDERGIYWECHGCWMCYRGEVDDTVSNNPDDQGDDGPFCLRVGDEED